ncbi:MAG: DUF1491 family protein [Beijerinckiaceae bacterium]|nr:DUF1491 family protein [Beijerinckiaceae bacterium]
MSVPRLRADIWVSAHLRRCAVEGAFATLRKRGAEEAGAILVVLDCLDGRMAVFGPAPQSEAGEDGVRRFARLHAEDWIDGLAAAELVRRETKFDSDLWIVDVEDRQGRSFLDLA